MVLEGTNSAWTQHQVTQLTENPKVMRVVGVHEHLVADDPSTPDTDEGDDSNFEVDVISLDGEVDHNKIPLYTPGHNQIEVPRAGDKVVVIYEDGHKKMPRATPLTAYTNKDRPSVGKAGMSRKKNPSDSSPAGDGDIYITEYTSYDGDPSVVDKGALSPEETWIQIAKHAYDEVEAATGGAAGMKVEVYDSPANDAAHISIELNKKNGGDASATWGIKFDLKTGEFKLLDSEGYGIVSDGAGNFTWYEQSVDFVDDGSTESL